MKTIHGPSYQRDFSRLELKNSQFKKVALVMAVFLTTVLVILILELFGMKH